MTADAALHVRLVGLDEIRRVAVLGAGTMGHGIAQVAAQAGWAVTLYDLAAAPVERGLARVRENLDKGVEKGKLGADARDAALARLAGTTLLAEAVAEADLVIEAVPEVLELKRSMFAAVAAAAPARALFASNTSSLSINAIARATERPERLVGMHFFNPVHLMKLVEVVRHADAADEAVELARAIVLRLGKEPIVARDVPGFASSRLGIALGLEAIRMVEAGVASARDIDTAMKLGYGHPMGPLELTDLVGLDVRLAIAEYLERELGPSFHPPELLRARVREGKLGKKSGEGFYRWDTGKPVG